MEPPAEIEQYSNNPSKIGQSSPTLSSMSLCYVGRNPLTFDLLFGELLSVLGCYTIQEIDIFVGVELGHFAFSGRFCALEMSGCPDSLVPAAHEDLHLLVKPVVHDKRVTHPDTRRFHWMSWGC